MALPVTITGISDTLYCVGPFKAGSALAIDSLFAGTSSSQWGDSSIQQIGQTFTVGGSAMTATAITVRLTKFGSPTDNLTISICTTDPSGTVLGTSGTIAASGLSSGALTAATAIQKFTFATPVSLSASTTYGFKIQRSGAVSGSNNFFYAPRDAEPDYTGGTNWNNNGSGWFAASSDLAFSIQALTDTGAYYFFGRDSSTATTLQCYKSTDPSTSWSSVASQTGYTSTLNQIAGFNDVTLNEIHLAVFHGSVSGGTCVVSYSKFDLNTETFSTAESVQSSFDCRSAGLANVSGCAITRRDADGFIIILYNGPRVASMGSSYSRVVYARRGPTAGSAWTANVAVDVGGQVNGFSPELCNGSSGRTHFFYAQDTPSQAALHKTLNSSNVLQTASSAFGSTPIGDRFTAISYNLSGTVKVRLTINQTTADHFGFDSADTPTISTLGSIASTAEPARSFYESGDAKFWTLYGLSTAINVRSSTDNASTFGSAATAMSSISIAVAHDALNMDAAIYLRGSDYVIPYIFSDAGTVKYNEYVVRSVASGTVNQKAITVTQSASVSLALLRGKTVKPTLAQVVTMLRSAGTRVPVSQTQSVIVRRSVAKQPVIIQIAQAVTVTASKALNKILSVQLGQSALARRSTAKLVRVTVAQDENLVARRSVSRSTTITQGQTVLVLRSIGHRISTTIGQLVTVTATFVAGGGAVVQKAITVAQAQSVLVQRAIGKLVRVTVAQDENVIVRRAIGRGVIITQGQTVLVRRSIGTRIMIAIGQLVTVTAAFVPYGGVATPKLVNVSQGQAITLFRSIRHLITITQAQSIVVFRNVTGITSKLITVTQAQSITLFRSIVHRITVAQAQAVLLLRSMARFVFVAQTQDVSGVAEVHLRHSFTGTGTAQTVTVFAAKAAGSTTSKLISVVQAQAVTLARAINKLINITSAFAIVVRTSLGKRITVATGQVVTLFRSIGHRITVAMGQVVTLLRSFAVGKIITVTMAQAVTLFRRPGKLVSVTQGQAITLFRRVGHIVIVAMAQAVTVFRQTQGITSKAINVTQAQAITLFRSIVHRVTVATAQVVTVATTAFKRKLISVTQAQVITLFRATVKRKLISVTQAQVVTVRRAAQRLVLVTQAQAIALFRRTGHLVIVATGQTVNVFRQTQGITSKLISVTQAQTVTVFRSIVHRITVTMPQVVTVFAAKAVTATNKLITVTQAQAVTLFRRIGHLVTVTMAQSVVVSRTAQGITSKLITVTQAQAITLFRSLVHRVTVSTAQVVTVLRSIGHRITTVTMGQTVTRIAVRLRPKAVTVTQAQSVIVRRRLGKLIAVLTAQTITTVRRIAVKIIRVSQAQSIALFIDSVAQVRLVFVSVVQAQAVTVTRNFARVFTIAQGMAVSVFAAFARRIRRGSISRGAPGDQRDNTANDIRFNKATGVRRNTDPWHSD